MTTWLEQARKRCEAATKGPWEWRKCYEMGDGQTHWAIESPESKAAGRIVGIYGTLALDSFSPPSHWHQEPNTQFIAHSRTDLPFALEKLAEAERIIEKWTRQVADREMAAWLESLAAGPQEGK